MFKNLYLAPECLGATMQLVAVSEDFYANGEKQAKPVGRKYDVLVIAQAYERLTVRIPGDQLVDDPGVAPVYVEFKDLRVRPYVDRNGRMAYSAVAEGIHVVPNALSDSGAKEGGTAKPHN